MSYDVVFWKQIKAVQVPAVEMYRKLNSRENMEDRLALPEIADLPVDEILAKLKTAFPDFDSSSSLPGFETPDGHYDVSWSKKHFLFMIYADLGDSLNKVTEILRGFNCPMYDPQENKRYDKDNGLALSEGPKFKSLTAEEKLERKRQYDAIVEQANHQFASSERTQKLIKLVLGFFIVVVLIAVSWYLFKR